MARIRSVKPALRTSLTVAEWPREVRYFFVLLWGYCDDFGRGVDDARLIKSDCFPLDDDINKDVIDDWLEMIARSGHDESPRPLCRYEVAGRKYLHCPNWNEHQRPSHPTPTNTPPCPEHDGEPLRRGSRDGHEVLVPEGEGEKGGGEVVREGKKNILSRTASRDTARPDVDELCSLLADRIVANGSKRPRITKGWRDAARLLLDEDGRTPEQVRNAITWCQGHDFWRGVVLSMPKLREKYDQLRLAAERGARARASPEGRRPGVAPSPNVEQ